MPACRLVQKTDVANDSLARAAEAAGYDGETVLVGSKLIMDMEKAGIHLEPSKRDRMQVLHARRQPRPSCVRVEIRGLICGQF
eukprot:366244-Chlamydomonas_euryale.AAC.14